MVLKNITLSVLIMGCTHLGYVASTLGPRDELVAANYKHI